jgi:hypothetical protein
MDLPQRAAGRGSRLGFGQYSNLLGERPATLLIVTTFNQLLRTALANRRTREPANRGSYGTSIFNGTTTVPQCSVSSAFLPSTTGK